MIDWAVVAAFIAPLIAAIGLVSGWFAWLGKRRDNRVAGQINAVTEKLEMRISQVEHTLANQDTHMTKQDDALSQAMQAIARIEGRLMGQTQITQGG